MEKKNILILLKDILKSFLEYFKINSQSLFFKSKKIVIVSALFYVIFLLLSFVVGWWLINYTIHFINNLLNIQYGIDDITPLNSFIIINLQVSIRAMVIMGVLALFKYVVLLFFCPAIYLILVNVLNKPSTFEDFKKHIKLSLYITYFHGKWDLIYFSFAFFLSFIPVLGIAIPLAFFVLQSYYIGNILLLLMYRTAYKPHIKITEIKKISSYTTGFSIGIGLGFTLLQCIPLIGMYFAPIFMLVVGRTILNKEMNVIYE